MSQEQARDLNEILGAEATVRGVVEFVQNELNMAERVPAMFKAGQEVLEKEDPTFEDALQYLLSVYTSITNDIQPLYMFADIDTDLVPSAPREPEKYIAQLLDDYLLPLIERARRHVA